MRRTILLGDRLASLAGDGLALLLADVGALQVSVFNMCVNSVNKMLNMLVVLKRLPHMCVGSVKKC